MGVEAITQETIQKALEVFASGGKALAKDATTTGITVGTGLVGYELEAPAKSLYPVVTKLRNRIRRVGAPVGATACNWKAITAINAANAKPTKAWGYAGDVIQVTEADKTAAYKLITLGGQVLLDAQTLSRNFDDVRARHVIDVLYALMIEEEKLIIGGSASAMTAPATPTLTVATTGGTIGAVAVGVKVAARTVEGLYYSGVGITNSSAEATTSELTGTTNKVTATVAAKKGAVQYDWYVGAAGGKWYFYGSTAVNTIVITSIPTEGTEAPTSDKSADADSFDGLIPQLIAGNAQYTSLDGAKLTKNYGSITEIDALLLKLYEAYKLSPTVMVMAPTQAQDIANKVIEGGGATILLPTGDAGARGSLLAGNAVTRYLNKTTQQEIEIMVDPYWPKGRIAFLTESLPFPNSNISGVFEIETQQEYQQIEYAASRASGATGGPRYDFENRCIEVLKVYAPAACAYLDNISEG